MEYNPLIIPLAYTLTKAAIEPVQGVPMRKLGGFLTTAAKDLMGQELIAAIDEKALDFSPYRKHGRWNDNHYVFNRDGSKYQVTVGFPTDLEFHKGKGWYTEGYLLPDDPDLADTEPLRRANYYWALAQIYHKHPELGKSLGFSIEGNTDEETPDKKKILKATVYNAAVTEVPINPECQATILKSFQATYRAESIMKDRDDLIKGLSTTTAAPLVRQDLGDKAVKKSGGDVTGLTRQEKEELIIQQFMNKNPKLTRKEAIKRLRILLSRMQPGVKIK